MLSKCNRSAVFFPMDLSLCGLSLKLQGPHRERGWGGALAPSLFCKNKVNLTKITEPKIAPPPPAHHSKICRAVPELDVLTVNLSEKLIPFTSMDVLNSLSSFEKQAAFHNTTPAEVSVFTFVLTNSHQTKAITKLPPKTSLSMLFSKVLVLIKSSEETKSSSKTI